MRRYTITVPLQDNAGEFRGEWAQVAEQLLAEHFTGWTRIHGIGYWRDEEDGKEYRESIAVFHLDIDEEKNPELPLEIWSTAQALATYCDQQAIYVTSEPIQTYLVVRPSLSPGGEDYGDGSWRELRS